MVIKLDVTVKNTLHKKVFFCGGGGGFTLNNQWDTDSKGWVSLIYRIQDLPLTRICE